MVLDIQEVLSDPFPGLVGIPQWPPVLLPVTIQLKRPYDKCHATTLYYSRTLRYLHSHEHLKRLEESCTEEAGKRGLAFRANGDTMSLMPPLIITESQLDEVFDIAREALDATAKAFGVI